MTPTHEICPAWTQRARTAGLSELPALLDSGAPPHSTAKWDRLDKPGLNGRARWRVQVECDGVAETLFVKRYARPNLRAQCDRFFRQTARHSLAWWEFQQSRRLADLRISVPQPVAFSEKMYGPIEAQSLVVLNHVRGDAFDRTWPRLCAARSPWIFGSKRHELTRRLASFVGAFHATGFRHRDLYLCHVFVELDSPGRAPAFHLIDLARTFQPARWRLERWTIKDLAQLDASARQIDASRADRLRFLLAYLQQRRAGDSARRLIAKAVRKSDRILDRIARKSRS